MKELALGAAMLASVVFSKVEVDFAPDSHNGLTSPGACDFTASDPELFSEEFDRLLCETARAIPYDSLGCFFDSFVLRLNGRTEAEEVFMERQQTTDEPQGEGFQILEVAPGESPQGDSAA